MNWQRRLKGKVRLNEPLKKYTNFKIGGAAEFFFEPDDADDLKTFLTLSKRRKIPFKIIGSGSNILASDKGFNGAVLKLTSPYFKALRFDGSFVECGAGNSLSRIIAASGARSLSGLEFLSGIPGTIGGALVMNAGTKDKSIGSIVESVTAMDYNGKTKIFSRKELNFGYRESNLSKYIVLACRLKLAKNDKRRITVKVNEYLSRRRDTQDLRHPSAGCVFKNPSGQAAGKLIDLCGLKGKRAGGAAVSQKHANFIINSGAAKSSDVLKLMGMIKRKVKERFNVLLKPEIKIWR